MSPTSNAAADERSRRWRLILGEEARHALGEMTLGEADAASDQSFEL